MRKNRRRTSEIDRAQMLWALSMGSRGGLLVAGPVLLGLVAGYWLDGRLGTLPWITLGLTLLGAVLGPIAAYRWIMDAVQRRTQMGESIDEEGEDT